MSKQLSDLDYQGRQQELEAILSDLQRDDIDVDQAMRCYQRGLEIVRELATYLKTAENTVSELKAKFSTD